MVPHVGELRRDELGQAGWVSLWHSYSCPHAESEPGRKPGPGMPASLCAVSHFAHFLPGATAQCKELSVRPQPTQSCGSVPAGKRLGSSGQF